MKPSIQLIGLDLDGTVFRDDKTISDTTIKAINEASKRGITVLPATGRPLSGLPDEILSLPGIRYALCSNGARIYDLKEALADPPILSEDRFNTLDQTNAHVIYENLLPLDTTLSILACTTKNPAVLNEIFMDGFGYSQWEGFHASLVRYEGKPLYRYIKKTRVPMKDMPQTIKKRGLPIEKMHILYPDQGTRDQSLMELKKLALPCCITHSMNTNLEINAATANKGTGLLALASILGIPRQHVMACGDSGNDLDMLKAAGYGVAMGNASEEVKNAADAVTLTNNEDGVAAAIYSVIKPRL